MQEKWWRIISCDLNMQLLAVPYLLLLLGIPAIMSIPFYFFNKWMLMQLRPRESFTRLFFYLAVILIAAFVYLTLVMYGMIQLLQRFNYK